MTKVTIWVEERWTARAGAVCPGVAAHRPQRARQLPGLLETLVMLNQVLFYNWHYFILPEPVGHLYSPLGLSVFHLNLHQHVQVLTQLEKAEVESSWQSQHWSLPPSPFFTVLPLESDTIPP